MTSKILVHLAADSQFILLLARGDMKSFGVGDDEESRCKM